MLFKKFTWKNVWWRGWGPEWLNKHRRVPRNWVVQVFDSHLARDDYCQISWKFVAPNILRICRTKYFEYLSHQIFWTFVSPNILSICLTKYLLPSKASVGISSLLNESSGILASYTRVSLKIPPFVFHTTVFTVKWPQPFLLNQKVNLNINKGIRLNMSETYAFWLQRENVSHVTSDIDNLWAWRELRIYQF